jgi:hypothetical protein
MSGREHDDPLLGPRLRDSDSPAAQMLKHASLRTMGTPSPQTVARIAALLEPHTPRVEHRKPFVLWWALASIGCVGMAFAGTTIYRAVHPVAPAITAETPAQHDRIVKRNTVTPTPTIESPPPVSEPTLDPPVEPPHPAPHRRPRPSAQARVRQAQNADSALAEESRLLGEALTSLRKNRDGRGALTALDRYAERFPDGELAHEAERTRVEALLSLGRSAETLQRLDAMTFAPLARDTELLLVRAELRASRNRCAESDSDFGAVLQRASSTQADRALFGRAACRLRRGDVNAARADLQEYVRRFPDGMHLREVKEALSRVP